MFAVPPELIDTPHAHDPVMLREVLSSAAIPAGATVVDGTFGRGGYARALLTAQPDCRYIALDRLDTEGDSSGLNVRLVLTLD